MFQWRKVAINFVILSCQLSLFANPSKSDVIPKYVWNLGFGIASDITPFPNGLPKDYITLPAADYIDPKNYVKDVKENDVIWVQSILLNKFYQEVLPSIKNHFILVINDGDESFPSSQKGYDINKLIQDERVIHIFAQNVDVSEPHEKITHLPIGIDFHSIAHSRGNFGERHHSVQDQAKQLDELLATLSPTSKRKMRAFVDFQFNDRQIYGGETRGQVLSKINPSGLIDAPSARLPRHILWQTKGQYAFSVSPHGNGLDCHRTWEDLVLGCIVIVKTSPLDPLYVGLPVVIVKDWSEINEENFSKWLIQYGDAFTNPGYREKLTHTYWMNKILSYKNKSVPVSP